MHTVEFKRPGAWRLTPILGLLHRKLALSPCMFRFYTVYCDARATASLKDICVVKIIAFPMSVAAHESLRYRDIWDFEWITRRLDYVETVAARPSRKAAARSIEGPCGATRRIMVQVSQTTGNELQALWFQPFGLGI